MVLNISDPMAFLNEQITKGQEKGSGTFKPTFFMLKDGEKALIRPLANLNAFIPVNMHEKFNQASPKDSIKAVCAIDYDLECQYCQDAKGDKKLTSTIRFVIPVYVHRILRKKVDDKGRFILDKGSPIWETVTYKNTQDEEIAVSGVRLLEMKRTSSILLDLNALYGEEGDITKGDIVIERKGAGLDTKYTTLVKSPSPFKTEIEEKLDRQSVLAWLADACPFMIAQDDSTPALTPASANGRGKTAIDDDF